MLNNQLGRRNLNPDQLSIIRGKLYNLYKLGHGGDRKSSGQDDHLKNTADECVEVGSMIQQIEKRVYAILNHLKESINLKIRR